MNLYYTPQALADLEAIADYLQQRSPKGATHVRTAILDSLQNLAQFPHIGRRQTVSTVRKIGIRKYKYLIYYSVDEAAEEIIILTVQHGAREHEYADS